MTSEIYTLEAFVTDLGSVLSTATTEPEILSRVAPLAKRVALEKTWLTPRLYEADGEQGFGSHPLVHGPDFTPFITVLSWLPGRGAPPHNHGTWAVVVGIDGEECNTFFERLDDCSKPGYAELRKKGERVCQPGDVLAMPSGTIHEVRNKSDRTSLSFHVYGRPLNSTGRVQFNAEDHTEAAVHSEVPVM